jgi:uncharacterized membrane protein YjjP (DUF1212 family)
MTLEAQQIVAAAEAKAAAAVKRLDTLTEQQERRVRWLVLGFSALASAFGVYRAIFPACRR